MTASAAKNLGAQVRDQAQRWFEAELLVGNVLKHERTWVALHPEELLTAKQAAKVKQLVTRRLTHEPIAYILGEAPFCSRFFRVNKHVLIPRPESERLVELGTAALNNGNHWSIWDVGAGSGCLALSLALAHPKTSVLASDRSKRALLVAKDNADRLQCRNVTFLNGSLLAKPIDKWLAKQADTHWLIVANLPYLPLTDKAKLQKQVVDHEPNQALFAEDDGLALIKRLLQQLKKRLAERTGDVILLEHDPRQARSLLAYAKAVFPEGSISLELDQNAAKRFTKIVL